MSFTADWLALREPADRAARNHDVSFALRNHFAAAAQLRIIDLGAGTGANMRACVPLMPAGQRWILVDNDAALLDIACQHTPPDTTIATRRCDLAGELDRAVADGADLVTASALFDLVSADWIDALVALLARRHMPLYAVLTYTGESRWEPSHPADGVVLAAFHADQRSDKGFGPALGPAAAAYLAKQLKKAGYTVESGGSPWLLDRGDQALMAALAEGIAGAVAEVGAIEAEIVADWLASRRTASACFTGHVDIFAVPSHPLPP